MDQTNITRQPVESSNIKAVGYDPATKVLEIEFLPRQESNKETNVVRYNTVPQETYDALINAESVGRYFHNEIKGKFPTNHPQNN